MTDQAPDETSPVDSRHQASGAAATSKVSRYLEHLTLRRQALAIRRNIVYGLVMGWILFLGASFFFFCVPGRLKHVDALWGLLMAVGLLHLALAVVLPQALYWPERVWTAIARWQGWLVMTVLLTVVYFALIWPASYFSRRRTHGFVSWKTHLSGLSSSWEPIEPLHAEMAATSEGRARSLPIVLFGVLGFFFRRGNYLLLPILVLLLILGLVLYFVQSTALAPFIYTLF